jgi:hypothetical protein
MHRYALTLCAVAISFTSGIVSAGVINTVTFSSDATYSNSNPPAGGQFRDFIAPTGINRGNDVGGTGNTALNFTLSAGSGGASAITLFDLNPTNATPTLFTGGLTLYADVLAHSFNNAKQPGILAYFNEGPGEGGIALLLSDAGNTDALILQKVGQTGIDAGGSNDLASVSLAGGLGEDAWYRLVFASTITGNSIHVTGQVYSHTNPSNPNSALGAQIGADLTHNHSLNQLGISGTGEVGLAFRTVSTTSSASVTNFSDSDPGSVGVNAAVPEPGTMFLLGGALIALGVWRRRD